jgi:hypothetical protein
MSYKESFIDLIKEKEENGFWGWGVWGGCGDSKGGC